MVRLYRLRWRIEETFRALKKDGLRLEETQVVEASAVMNLASLALAAAVRIVQLVDARDGSSRPATDVISSDQIDAVAAISAAKEGGRSGSGTPGPEAACRGCPGLWPASAAGTATAKSPAPKRWPTAGTASAT